MWLQEEIDKYKKKHPILWWWENVRLSISEWWWGIKKARKMMRKKRSVKAMIFEWDSWVELCEEYGVDPWEVDDVSEDKGMGDSIDYEFYGDRPEKEEE